MLYPLFFKPVYKSALWGGRNIEKLFGRELEDGYRIGESWDICCHVHGMSIVENGHLAGKTLDWLIGAYGSELIGIKAMKFDRFPILVKLIDATERLSVQVHPDSSYALANHGDWGKTELQYVIHAEPGARIINGVRDGTTKEELKTAMITGSIEKLLVYNNVENGDSFLISPGMIHAILDGLVIAEIQQNSDTTYRVFDWNRLDKEGKSRELHIQNALDVIDPALYATSSITTCKHDDYDISKLARCECFNVDKLTVHTNFSDTTSMDSFQAYTVVGGSGCLVHGSCAYTLVTGTSFLLPASIGAYMIQGDMELLKTWL